MSQTQHLTKTASELDQLYQDYWEFFLKEFPTIATYLGDHRYDDRLDEVSEEAFHRRINEDKKYLEQLKRIKRPSLPSDRLNYDLFERELSIPIAGAKFHPYVLPISQQIGPHIDLPQIITYHPFNILQDYDNYITRLERFPDVFDQVTDCLRIGIKEKIVHPRVIVDKMIPQLQVQIVDDPGDSELHKPVKNIPKTLTQEDQVLLEKRVDEAILGSVIPAYAKLLAFMTEEYLPAARSSVGLWAVPEGRQWYEYDILYNTTTRMSPVAINRLGQRELSRIQREMQIIMKKLGFKGSFIEFAESVRNDKSQYYATGEAIIEGYRKILARMDTKLPLLFGKLPSAKYDFREIEAFRADAAPAAYYYIAPEDRSRPAYFYVNTYKPETRPKYMMEALAYHEAVPGHHLQLAIQQELTELPKFRRHGGYTAFIEGWALYAEQLGKEVGFYEELLSDFGRLAAEAWRAARLVVDTGIHALKWSREKAIIFLKTNSATSEQDIVSEVDRYIAWPGQALAYKIGQLEISSLRKKAIKKLGRKFDVRQFHDQLLSEGALPLAILAKRMATGKAGKEPVIRIG
ncbi:MAG TPA: DUF885 domain-containing protein [Candidatus Bathyarchaeia archaeon]|nr:DUF885 domain-containing protein [Candidatus Bathyarchaeia archaeon]